MSFQKDYPTKERLRKERQEDYPTPAVYAADVREPSCLSLILFLPYFCAFYRSSFAENFFPKIVPIPLYFIIQGKPLHMHVPCFGYLANSGEVIM